MDNRGIGVFDSGVGGLTVVKEIMNILPFEKIIYLGDTARTPYGSKTKETIIRFSIQNTKFLLKKNVKIIVIACNTSSALALPYLNKNFNLKLFGVIKAGAKAAVETTKNRKIGVIGTKATINSSSYVKEIKKFDKKIRVYTKPTPLLVPLVEEGWLKRKETEDILNYYLNDFKKVKIDTLVLGCTHYPLLTSLIKKILPGINIINSAEKIALEVKDFLEKNDMLCSKKSKTKSYFYVTDSPEPFNKIGRMFLKEKMINAKKIQIGE